MYISYREKAVYLFNIIYVVQELSSDLCDTELIVLQLELGMQQICTQTK